MGWFKREHPPRIAYRRQRNGVKRYYVEAWATTEAGSWYMQDSPETTSLAKAKKMLKKISDEEVVAYGVVSE